LVEAALAAKNRRVAELERTFEALRRGKRRPGRKHGRRSGQPAPSRLPEAGDRRKRLLARPAGRLAIPGPAPATTPPRPTVRQVAALAGVSTATVSRALAGASVNEALRGRVLEAATLLNYRPNRAARSLRGRRSLTVGVVIPDIQNSFFTGIVRGIEQVLEAETFTFLLGNSDGRPDRERVYLETLRSEGAAGFITVPSQSEPELYRELQAAGLPVVTLDRAAPGLSVDHVTVTNQEGARAAVHHLLRLGHRRIGYVGGPPDLNVARERLAGYEQALQEAGLAADRSLMRAGDFQQAGGLAAAQGLLDLPSPPTAIFVANNLMTLGAYQALHERGLRIPSQVAVVGFDDMPWATALRPPLTAVMQPTFELGKAAAQLLMARLRDPRRPFRRVVLETRLLIRGSCGAGGSGP
jgi:DNA-binding LacI/PurR family transcriptional regulator